MSNKRIKIATYGRRTLSYVIDIGIVTIVAAILYGNVTQTFMYESMGGKELEADMRTYSNATGLFEETDEGFSIIVKSYTGMPHEEELDKDGNVITPAQEKHGYLLYLETIHDFYTDFLYNYEDAVTITKTVTSGGQTTTVPYMRPWDENATNEDYVDHFNQIVMGLPTTVDYERVYDTTVAADEALLSGDSEYFRYAVDETGKIDKFALPELQTKPQRDLDDGDDVTANALRNIFLQEGDANGDGLYMDAAIYALGWDDTGEQTYYPSLENARRFIAWANFIPAYVPIYFIIFFLIPLCTKNGETLGKLILKEAVITIDGFRIGWKERILRPLYMLALGMLLLMPNMYLGFMAYGLIALLEYMYFVLSKTHQTFHGKLTKTIVIDARESVWFKDLEDEENYMSLHPEELEAPHDERWEIEQRRLEKEAAILDLSTLNKHREEARLMTSFDEFERMKDLEESKKTDEDLRRGVKAEREDVPAVNFQKVEETEEGEPITPDSPPNEDVFTDKDEIGDGE